MATCARVLILALMGRCYATLSPDASTWDPIEPDVTVLRATTETACAVASSHRKRAVNRRRPAQSTEEVALEMRTAWICHAGPGTRSLASTALARKVSPVSVFLNLQRRRLNTACQPFSRFFKLKLWCTGLVFAAFCVMPQCVLMRRFVITWTKICLVCSIVANNFDVKRLRYEVSWRMEYFAFFSFFSQK